MTLRIEIARRNYLLYLLLSHPRKMALLSPASRLELDEINRRFNERLYSGQGAESYDRIHRYDEAEQHEYPAKLLAGEVWAPDGYGRALELGSGSGFFTALIARRASTVVAVEPVPDMQRAIRTRCEREGLGNVEIAGVPAVDLAARLPAGSVDSVVVIQSLHHLHRRPEVFRALGHVVRPGGRLFLLEPHHNLKRIARLFVKYLQRYRAASFRADPVNWATHDFLTRAEIRALSAAGGFEDVHIDGYWLPYARRLVPDPRRRFGLERSLGRLPIAGHFAAVLAVEARRGARESGGAGDVTGARRTAGT